MRAGGYFVTGTDTGVGKTRLAAALLRHFAGQGLRAAGMKPVASGCEERDGRLINEDVLALRAASNVDAPPDLINPYAFAPPIAPHIAARQAGTHIELAHIAARFDVLSGMADVVVVEGAGGLLVPLNDTETMADLAAHLGLPLILVVGMRLGCINHALLTAEAILRRGLSLLGWVANRIDPHMASFDANLSSLEQRIPSPLLAIMPHLSAPEKTILIEWITPLPSH